MQFEGIAAFCGFLLFTSAAVSYSSYPTQPARNTSHSVNFDSSKMERIDSEEISVDLGEISVEMSD